MAGEAVSQYYIRPQRYYRWAFIHFWLVAAIGLILRSHYLWPFSHFKVTNWLHAHSHVAFLGWIFFVLLGAMFRYFPEFMTYTRRQQQWLFYLLLTSVWGMLFTFIWQGYGLFSIAFSTLHMVLSILVAIGFFRKAGGNRQLSVRLMRWALIFMLISSAGPLLLGPLSAMGLKTSKWYQLSIYFYLHFQYNGWFTLAILSLLFRMIPVNGESAKNKRPLTWAVVGILLTYTLSALGYQIHWGWHFIGGLGAVMQLWALGIWVKKLWQSTNGGNSIFHWMLKTALFFLSLKIGMQFFSAFPAVVDLTYYQRDMVIAYLHLVLLGFASSAALYLVFKQQSLLKNVMVYWWIFIGALAVMEAVLVAKSYFFSLPRLYSDYMLWLTAIGLFLSVTILMLKYLRNSTSP